MADAIEDSFTLALAQLNPVVGDIDGNLRKARAARADAAASGADLVAFTELYLTGYPLEDLVLKPALQEAARAACEELPGTRGTAALPYCSDFPGRIGRLSTTLLPIWIKATSRR